MPGSRAQALPNPHGENQSCGPGYTFPSPASRPVLSAQACSSGCEFCPFLSTCLNPATQALLSPLQTRPPQVLSVPKTHCLPPVLPLTLPSSGADTMPARLISKSHEAPRGVQLMSLHDQAHMWNDRLAEPPGPRCWRVLQGMLVARLMHDVCGNLLGQGIWLARSPPPHSVYPGGSPIPDPEERLVGWAGTGWGGAPPPPGAPGCWPPRPAFMSSTQAPWELSTIFCFTEGNPKLRDKSFPLGHATSEQRPDLSDSKGVPCGGPEQRNPWSCSQRSLPRSPGEMHAHFVWCMGRR